MRTKWMAGLATSLALVACGTSTSPPKQGGLPPARRAPVVLGQVSGTVDPSGAAGPQLIELPIIRDGLAGLNPPDTIEVYSPGLASVHLAGASSCTGLDTWEAPVRVKNYFQEELSNVYVEFTSITGGSSRVCTGLSRPPDANPGLSTAFGVVDYTNGGNPATIGLHAIGAYATDRNVSGGTIAPNGDSSATPGTGDAVWAFAINSSRSPFTYVAHVVGDIRPVPASLESPYVDTPAVVQTGNTVSQLLVFTYDPVDPLNYGTSPGIATAANVQIFSNAGLSTLVGSTTTTAINPPTDPTLPAVGAANAQTITSGRAGTTLYVKLQNTWLSGLGSTLLGVNQGDAAFPSFLVTNVATTNSGARTTTNRALQMVTDTHAYGAEVNVYDGGTRLTGCNSNPTPTVAIAHATYIWNFGSGNVTTPPTSFPINTDPGLGGTYTWTWDSGSALISNRLYCYRVHNVFAGNNTGGNYPGAWSTWGSLRGP